MRIKKNVWFKHISILKSHSALKMNILDMKYVLNKSPFPNEISVFSKFESICQSTKDLPFPLSQASPASLYTCDINSLRQWLPIRVLGYHGREEPQRLSDFCWTGEEIHSRRDLLLVLIELGLNYNVTTGTTFCVPQQCLF